MKCEICEKSHPTLLHDPSNVQTKDESPSEQVVSNAVASAQSNFEKSSMVVPVWLTHSTDPHRSRLVYALLDSQSDSSFILDQTLDSFAVSSMEVNLTVSTMIGSNQSVSSQKSVSIYLEQTTQLNSYPSTYGGQLSTLPHTTSTTYSSPPSMCAELPGIASIPSETQTNSL